MPSNETYEGPSYIPEPEWIETREWLNQEPEARLAAYEWLYGMMTAEELQAEQIDIQQRRADDYLREGAINIVRQNRDGRENTLGHQ